MGNVHSEYLRKEIDLHEHLAPVYKERRYGPLFSRIWQQHWNRRLLGMAQVVSGSIVVDFGCGTGVLFPELVERGARVIGVDLSIAMLSQAEGDLTGVSRVCCDGTSLSLPNNSADVVICRGSIHHLPNLEKAFEEIYRVLKPGGRLVFSEPSNDSFINRIARQRLYKDSEDFNIDDEGFRRREILPMLKNIGLEVELSRGFGFFGYTFAGFPDQIGILKHIPGACVLTRLMIVADNFIERIPLIETLALHWQVRARKAIK